MVLTRTYQCVTKLHERERQYPSKQAAIKKRSLNPLQIKVWQVPNNLFFWDLHNLWTLYNWSFKWNHQFYWGTIHHYQPTIAFYTIKFLLCYNKDSQQHGKCGTHIVNIQLQIYISTNIYYFSFQFMAWIHF